MNDHRTRAVDRKSVILSTALRNLMLAHARESAPRECCGLLAGRRDDVGRRVERVLPLANIDPRSTRFLADPSELLDALRAIDADGLELVGIYHSHPASPAYPSPTDVSYARGYPQALHLIVSLQDPEHPVLRAYSIDREAIAELSIVDSDSPVARQKR